MCVLSQRGCLITSNEEDTFVFFNFYATEEERQDWRQQFPDRVMQPRADLPFDRDKSLPETVGRIRRVTSDRPPRDEP